MESKKNYDSRRGSALLVAIFFAVALGIILGSYLKMAMKEMEFADASFMYNSLLNRAELMIEEATWAYNNDDWTGWTSYTSTGGLPSMRLTVAGIDLGNGKKGTVYIIVEDYDDDPVIYVEALVTLPGGRVISKQLQIELYGKSIFATGLVAKNKITFGGNIQMDSYNSSDGLPGPGNSNANITTGSLSADPGMVTVIGTVDVYGFLGTGGPPPIISSPSTLKGPDTPIGVDIDLDRISTSLSGQFEDPVAPVTTGFIKNLPGGNAFVSRNLTIGDSTGATTAEYLLTDDLSLGGTSVLTIDGPTIIVMGTNKSVTVGGTAQIEVTATGSLALYTDGDVTIGGKGMVNAASIPSNLIIYGTDPVPNGQTITLRGTSDLQAVIYTPNANLTLSGTNSTSGSIVANQINVSGTVSFHYDEALADSPDGDQTLQMSSWREMVSAAERKGMKAILYEGFGSGSYPYYP